MGQIEVLAPAGSSEALLAATRCGADAVYLGGKQFSARANAKNFDKEELKNAVDYCHKRNIKIYVTANTLIFDDEMQEAMDFIKFLCSLPVDAVIVQDIGMATLIRKLAKDMPIHGSTQMSIHTPDGAKALYEAGFSRVVLSRELSKNEIKEIKKASPIELEVFVHGALCMSVSGQCYFSSVLGGRSGNRGCCAQPCRLPFSVENKGEYGLSLKDLSIIEKLNELNELGVASAKIEGRMKRPEYIAAAVTACRQVLDKGKADAELIDDLEKIFARSGFTKGYYDGARGKSMFGFRKKEDVVAATNKVFSKMHELYRKEMPKIPVSFDISISENKPIILTAFDDANNAFKIEGMVAQKLKNKVDFAEKCKMQLKKTGGTQFYCKEVRCNAEEGAGAPLGEINELRRQALHGLESKIGSKVSIKIEDFNCCIGERYNSEKELKLRARVPHTNIPKEFSKYEIVYVPLFSKMSEYERLLKLGINVLPEIPRGMFSREEAIKNKLNEVKSLGINEAWAGNIGAVYTAMEQGFGVHGGYSLNVANTYALEQMKKCGLLDVELSFETSLDSVKMLGSSIKRGIIGYGRLPLMLTRNCPFVGATNTCANCKTPKYLTDRKGIKFPFMCDGTCTEILNSVPLYMLDKMREIKGVDFMALRFSVENLVENVEKSSSFNSFIPPKEGFTRGLYYKSVN